MALVSKNWCRFTTLLCGLLAGASGTAQQGPTAPDTAATLPDSPGFQQAASAQAQTASISGLITDVNGGIVPGATILVLDSTGNPVQHATADAGGAFHVDGLSPGRYRLRIQAPGLQPFRTPAVTLAAGQKYKLPDTALPIATAQQTVDVFLTREQIADQEMKDETKQRVLGIVPNFYTSYVWNAAPLNARQKFQLGFRASLDPWVFLSTGITAGIEQASGTYPTYGPGPAGYARRYGAAYGDALTGRIIGSAVFASLFHQDPRYFYQGTGGVGRRTVHALVSSVAARTDHGHIEPNYTQLLGDFTAGFISRSWHPGHGVGVSLAVDDTLFGILDAAAHNVAQEFLLKRISKGTPPLAKGKPPEQKESAAHP